MWNRVLQRLGLVYPAQGRAATPGRSRYGQVSRRLDEDIDDLKARLAEMERALAEPEG